MTEKKPPTLEEFRARAALTGLPLTAEDIEHLHKGYVGLLCSDGAHPHPLGLGRRTAARVPRR